MSSHLADKTPSENQLTLSSLKNYNNFIKRTIEWKLSSRTQNTRDLVYDKVIDGLTKAIKEKRVKAIYGDASIRGYIYGIVRHKCYDCFREPTREEKRLLKGKVEPAKPEDDQYDSLYKKSISIENAAILTEYEIRKLFARLGLDKKLGSIDLQIAIKLIREERRREIADDLGLTINQAKGKIERVRKKITDPSVREALKKAIKKQKHKPRMKWRKTQKGVKKP